MRSLRSNRRTLSLLILVAECFGWLWLRDMIHTERETDPVASSIVTSNGVLGLALASPTPGLHLDPFTPESIGAHALTAIKDFPDAYHMVVMAVIQHLQKRGEDPDTFYATMESTTSPTQVVVHLWHQSVFMEGKAVFGDPSGKSRDMIYDFGVQSVVSTTFWR